MVYIIYNAYEYWLTKIVKHHTHKSTVNLVGHTFYLKTLLGINKHNILIKMYLLSIATVFVSAIYFHQ